MPSIMETRRASFQKKEDAEIEIALADRVENWAKKMLDKLIENKAKGYPEGWEKNPTEQLIERVEEEFIELKTAIKKRQSHKTITAEAADVANMAMMVSDAYKYRNT